MKDTFKGIRYNIFVNIQNKISKFNNLKKTLNLKSNELSYHLKKLTKSGLVKKIIDENQEIRYVLTNTGKNIYPYLNIIRDDILPVFVVTSVAIIDNENVYLRKKAREPEKDKLIFIGGKAKIEKTIKESAIDYLKEENLEINPKNLKLKCINEYCKYKYNTNLEKNNKTQKEELENHWTVYFYTYKIKKEENFDHKNLIKIKITDAIKSNELFGDNKYFLKHMLHNTNEVKVIKTKF